MNNSFDKNKILIAIVGGIFIGFLNGFFGGGGGMIVVPLLVFLLKLTEKEAHATAIFIILPMCVASSIIYMLQQNVDYIQLMWSVIGFIVGGIIGALLLKKINNKILRIIFSAIMVLAGVRLLF